jgi:hypothetical protein
MVSYIPVLTSLLSVFFLTRIVPHYLAKRSPYLLWWTLGVLTFGLGTLTESINAIYGWSFLFGGAVYSAIKYFAVDKGRTRFLGNILIAVGAVLPAIGGLSTRFGYVEVLYITELIGLSLIYLGYHIIRQGHSASVHASQQVWQGSLSPG